MRKKIREKAIRFLVVANKNLLRINFPILIFFALSFSVVIQYRPEQKVDTIILLLAWLFFIFIIEGLFLIFVSVAAFALKEKQLAKGLFSKGLFISFFSLIAHVVITFVSTPIEKPVIYLYPTEKTNVLVQLDFQGKIIADYPSYNESIRGWEVEAHPDGRLVNKADGKEYSYIFWEGKQDTSIKWNLQEGFVVRGEDSREFLQQTLSEIGLTPREYNEFIVYWYPLMKDNPYNLIHFAGEKYTESAKLTISPEPDSVLRVFMVFKPLKRKIEVVPQEIKPFERKGFAVVEWGGAKVR